MKKLFALLIGLMVSTAAVAQPSSDYKTISINDSLTKTEKKVRSSAVKITDGHGHGSGAIVNYYDLPLVLTAQHVASGLPGTRYYVVNGSTWEEALLIYSDPAHDIAILYLRPEGELAERGMKYSPRKDLLEVGGAITYSGHPSWHNLMTFRGYVAGVEVIPGAGIQLMLNTYGWFGCSGSVIYDSSGDIAGILWGVDIEGYPDLQVQENMIWVSPIQNLDMPIAIAELCLALENEPKACRR